MNQISQMWFRLRRLCGDDNTRPPPAKRRKVVSSDDDFADIVAETPDNDELQSYISSISSCSDSELLSWWDQHSKEYPQLAMLARKYHCIPASSGSSERSFSSSGNLITKKRTALDKDNVNDLLYIHANATL